MSKGVLNNPMPTEWAIKALERLQTAKPLVILKCAEAGLDNTDALDLLVQITEKLRLQSITLVYLAFNAMQLEIRGEDASSLEDQMKRRMAESDEQLDKLMELVVSKEGMS